MKKKGIILILGIFIFLLGILIISIPTSIFAGYYSIGLSNGGEDNGRGLSLEAGSRDIYFGDTGFFGRFKENRFLAAVILTALDHEEGDIPSDTIVDPYPPGDCTNLGNKPEGIESGILGKFGIELFGSNVYTSILQGITHGHEVHLMQSNITGDYYEQSSDTKLYYLYGISLGYFTELFDWKLKLNIQIDYDNRRGVTGLIGWGW